MANMTVLRRAFAAPAVMVLVLFLAVPLCIVLLYSLRERGVYGGITDVWTIQNYVRLFDSLYGAILLRTFAMAGAATAGCLLLGFPLALFIARSGKRKSFYLQLVILPFWTSFLVRTYAWLFLLRDTGLINTVLLALGIVREPLPLLYNDAAVFVGLVYGFLPFVVLPLYAILERIDISVLEASADLGATPWQTVTRIVIPLAMPGFRAAGLLVFIPCLGAYLTPDLLGGGRSVMAGNLIQNQFTTSRDWPFGSAVSLLLMAVVMIVLMMLLRRRGEELL